MLVKVVSMNCKDTLCMQNRNLENDLRKWRKTLKVLWECNGQLNSDWKVRGRRQLHSKGGRTPFILYKNIKITRLHMYSHAAWPKLWGKSKNRKKLSSSVQKNKIKMTSLTHSLSTILRLGITQGTYNIRRCLFACMTAALSADILSIDAQPYCLAFGMSISSVDSVLSTNTKRIINTKIRKWKRTVQVLVLQ